MISEKDSVTANQRQLNVTISLEMAISHTFIGNK